MVRKRLNIKVFRWAVLAPICIYGAALLVGAIWLPRLPNPMASQWSGDSVASTQSLAAFYATLALPMLGTVAFLYLLGLKSKNPSEVRLCIAGCNGVGVFVSGAMLLLASGQLDIADAQWAPSPSWIGMAAMAVLGVAVGLGVWRLCDGGQFTGEPGG